SADGRHRRFGALAPGPYDTPCPPSHHSWPVDAAVEPRITHLIASAEKSDRRDADGLFEALYAELHRLARAQLARNGGGVTLGVTTLLHEAYLDISQRESLSFLDRGRFMAYAA